MKRETILKGIILLSVLGFIISLYLVQNHYAGVEQGSFCDFGETISCSLVNTSVYSVFLGVPVAVFGALWFVILFLLSWKALKKTEMVFLLLVWNVLGMLFVGYMIYAEIILQALCPLCTVVHIMVVLAFALSVILYRASPQKITAAAAKPWIYLVIVIFGGTLLLFNLDGEEGNQDALAKCLTEKGAVMYGSFRCGVCAKTREMFGDSFQYITEVECHPQGVNSQWPLCQLKGISATPTWILEPNDQEVKRNTGFLSLAELQRFSGCTL